MPSVKLRLCPALALIAIFGAAGCDLEIPRDPEGTLRRARGGTLRVGVAPAGEWVRVPALEASENDERTKDAEVAERAEAGEPDGVEPELVRRLARELDAEIRWVRGSESELLGALERFEVDIVLAGLTRDSPWRQRVGLTRAYTKAGGERVIAVGPGENAFLLELERFLEREKALIARLAPDTVR
jgi:polar amino acid transport system substrate-binding protein